MCFFPVVGMITGICVWAAGTILLKHGFGVLFFSAVMTLVPIAINGGIHMDGFLDTVDALGSWEGRERKLEILKDPHAGAFAVMGACCYFTACMGLWSEAAVDMLPVVAWGYVLSRGLSGLAVLTFPSASKEGLARTFKEGTGRLHAGILFVLFVLAPMAAMLSLSVKLGALGVAGAVLVFFYYRVTAVSKFGGVTGDLAGYFLQLCELAILGFVVMGGTCL